ncbi:hypothetical protein AB834_02790 [PVC group bacterium (ex Bugula neritina AB1)]|nr:hypothetical protein AB834_02790 [PVC group bacterium (ex Bugula neritina AB1)]
MHLTVLLENHQNYMKKSAQPDSSPLRVLLIKHMEGVGGILRDLLCFKYKKVAESSRIFILQI